MSRAEMRAASGARGKFVVVASGAIMLALFLVIASVAFASWPTADDYCSRVLVAERGVSGALHWLFFEWSGRLVTGIPLYLIFAWVDLPTLRWISIGLVCLFAVAAYQVGSLVAGEDLPLRWPLCAFVLAALSLGLYRLIGQTVLWATGGVVYALPLVLTLLWLTGVRRLLRGDDSSSGNGYGFALGVLVGDSIELVLPIIAAYVVLVVPSRWKDLSLDARRALAWRIAGVIVGAAVLIAAPGNYGRARFTPGSFRVDPAYLAGEFAHMLSEIGARTSAMLAIVAALVVLSIIAATGQRRSTLSDTGPSPWRESTALFVGALASITPVLAAPAQFAPRNGLYLLVFALAAAMIPLVAYARHARWRPIAAPTLIGLAAAGAVASSVPLVADAQLTSAFRDRQITRDRMLRQLAQRGIADATVPSILQGAVPATLHFIEINPDRAQWSNVCIAKYYGFHSIALEPAVR